MFSPSNNKLKNIGEVVTDSTSRIKELDGLRGIAILMVILFHYGSVQLKGNTNPIAKLIDKVTYFGWAGVDLFFVLSGFLICSILLRYKTSKNYFSTFFIRRVLRIIPNFFLLLLIYFFLANLLYFSDFLFLTDLKGVPLWSYFAMIHNVYMANANSFGSKALSVTWSIGIEEQFYIIFPFIVFFFKTWWLAIFLLLVIICAPFIRYQYEEWIPAYVLLPGRMDSLAFGALIAFINFYYDLKGIVNKYYALLLLIIILDILMCVLIRHIYGDLGMIRHTLFAILFSGLLLVAVGRPKALFTRFLRNKMLGWIGTISYSLYLFHYIILGISHYIFSGKAYPKILNENDIFITMAALFISFLFSYLIYNYVESPAVLLGKKISFQI